MQIKRTLERLGITHSELASHLGIGKAGMSLRLSGARRWSVGDVLVLDRLLRDRGSKHRLRELLEACAN